jgi:FAD synthetase
LKESAAERTAKYLEVTSESLKRLKPRRMPAQVSASALERVLELVRGYVRDAEHYAGEQRPVTSLACVSYAEGLLDAVKFLELVDF